MPAGGLALTGGAGLNDWAMDYTIAYVPLVNSDEWYHALRDNGVPVRFYAYPANTHFPGDIVRTTDIFRRVG